MLVLLIIIISVIFIVWCFETYTDMDYVKHLEEMGVFVDEDGKEI